MRFYSVTFLTLASVLCAAGCAPRAPLTITTYGEDYIESGIPASAFADGWTVTFDKFLVVFAEVQIADAAGQVAGGLAEPTVFDLTRPGPVTVAELGEVPAQRWDEVRVVVEPAEGLKAGSASDDDVARMEEGEHSVLVEGVANDAARAVSFSWAFDTKTAYVNCETDGEGAGIVVRAGEDNVAELTVHGDHLFYDDLASPTAKLRFAALAAADGALDGSTPDNVVSQAELAGIDLTSLPSDQYTNAGAAETLWDFVTALTRTLVHFNGEGHCAVQAR